MTTAEEESGLTVGDWELARDVSEWIEIVAIVVIAIAVVIALVSAARIAFRGRNSDAIEMFKQQIGRGLLLGLDLLIAADIIRTVTLEPTLENVAALGLLVVVRTFLAWSVTLEVEGHWPWDPERRGRRTGGTD